MSKHVIFVLDTSGSMSGKKMQQTKNAMNTILTDLREKDSMTIIEFDDSINVWKDDTGIKIFQASLENKENAIEFGLSRLCSAVMARDAPGHRSEPARLVFSSFPEFCLLSFSQSVFSLCLRRKPWRILAAVARDGI